MLLATVLSFLQRLYYALIADRDTRDIYYRVMGAQLRAGMPLERAVEQAGAALRENQIAKIFAKRLERMRYSGKMITQDWCDSNVLPRVDAELLIVAERNGELPEMFRTLSERLGQAVGIFHMIIKPNLYYVFAAVAATGFLIGFSDFLELIAGRYPQILEGQISYQLSVFMRSWAWAFAFVIGMIVVVSKALSEFMPPRLRRYAGLLVAPFDNARAVHYLGLSKLLAKQGATFTKNVEVAMNVMGSSPYFVKCLKRIGQGLRRGDDFMVLIRGNVVPREIASILQGLAPASKRDLLPAAFETAEIILIERMRTKYSTFKTFLLLGLVMYAAGIIGMMVLGMYNTTAELTDVVSAQR